MLNNDYIISCCLPPDHSLHRSQAPGRYQPAAYDDDDDDDASSMEAQLCLLTQDYMSDLQNYNHLSLL